jgi:hypothetical protein
VRNFQGSEIGLASIELSHGVFEPGDLRLVRDVFEHITAEPLFPRGSAYREAKKLMPDNPVLLL